MIRFFRQIRFKLMTSGNTSKYLKYAIGEIILVVIGILIALQINNWNENRKDNIAIRKVLKEINEDLLEDVTELEKIIQIRTEDFEAQKRIISSLENKIEFNDSIGADLGHVNLFRPFFSASKGYELLKELNLGSLKNKSLRGLLSQYYERDIPAVHQENNDDKFEFEDFWLPYVREHLSEWKFGQNGVPRNYSQMLDDKVLLTSVRINLSNVRNTIDAYEKALKSSRMLIEIIDKEN